MRPPRPGDDKAHSNWDSLGRRRPGPFVATALVAVLALLVGPLASSSLVNARPAPEPAPTPNAAPAGGPGFTAPAGTVPPHAEVVVRRAFDLRGLPEASLEPFGPARPGDRLVAGRALIVDGVRWQEFWGSQASYAVLDEGYPEVDVLPVSCPVSLSGGEILRLSPWELLACFGGRPLTFVAQLCYGYGGTFVGELEPIWLAWILGSGFAVCETGGDAGGLFVAVEPGTVDLSSLPEPQPPSMRGEIVRITGHANHPASASCSMKDQESSEYRGRRVTADVAPDVAVLLCRERFVSTSFEIIEEGPDAGVLPDAAMPSP